MEEYKFYNYASQGIGSLIFIWRKFVIKSRPCFVEERRHLQFGDYRVDMKFPFPPLRTSQYCLHLKQYKGLEK